MAEKQELEITISNAGDVEIHVSGTAGSSCMELTRDLEEALGIVIERSKTSEYYKVDIPDKNLVRGTVIK